MCESSQPKFFSRIKDKSWGLRSYWKCCLCGLVYLDAANRLSPEFEKQRYDTHQNRCDDQNYIRFLSRLAGPLAMKLAAPADGLDYGCGPVKALGLIFNKMGHTVESYDPYYFADASLLAREYDFISCSETVEHFYNPRKEFQLFNRLLKEQNGYLGIMTQILQDESGFDHWWYRNDPTHVSFYQPQTFEWIADWQGWSLDSSNENVMIFSKGERVNGSKENV